MTPERLADLRKLISTGRVGLKPETAKEVFAHIRDLEAQVREGVRLATKLIEETNKWAKAEQSVRFPGSWSTAFTDLNDWSDDADELLATTTPPSPEVDYRREGEHGRPLPNNWPSPEVGE
jgi:hypothetical protein